VSFPAAQECATILPMGALEELINSIVNRFGDALNDRRFDLLDGLLAPDFVRHCQASPWVEVNSPEAFQRFLEGDFAGVPDARIESRLMVAEGDYVALWNTYTGAQTGPRGGLPPTGKRVNFEYSGRFRFSEGKIAELWVVWDNLAILAQLGQWPPPAA
jgi:predicted ester cyclase